MESDPNSNQPSRSQAFAILETIAAHGGTLRPKWEPTSEHGYVFQAGQSAEEVKIFEKYAYMLVRQDYLEEKFFDRVTRCPKCSSHHLNLREVCPECGSAEISPETLLHHFRCGYVGASHTFLRTKAGVRVCPKCDGKLENLGVDHDVPGESLKCRGCHASFQQPPVAAMCQSCLCETPADQLTTQDIHSFTLAPRGREALRHGTLSAKRKARLVEDELPLFRSDVLTAFLQEEHKRVTRYGTPYAALMLHTHYAELELSERIERERELVTALREQLRNVDLLGRFGSDMLVASLPMTAPALAAQVLDRVLLSLGAIKDVVVNGTVVQFNPGSDFEQVFREATARLQPS